jgi:hypothetical protein
MDCHIHRSSDLRNDNHPKDCMGRAPAETSLPRRVFLLLGATALIGGCAEKQMTATLPGPVWKPRNLPPEPVTPKPLPSPTGPPNLLARSRWSGGDPIPSLMDRMTTIQWITVHHDGMDPFFGADEAASRGRLESIRRAHRNKGWGDIGYHYAIDRNGRVWEGRSIAYQGAHVKDCNPGNIGVLCMGNFDKQKPTQAQLTALDRHINWLMKNYKINSGRLRTHQEWPSAATACPGVSLQRYMLAARQARHFA